jgi:hypothetical protein
LASRKLADEGDGLQVTIKAVMNIMNNQSWISNEKWSSNLIDIGYETDTLQNVAEVLEI